MTADEAAPTPDDAYIPDAVAEACFPAWNEQACNAGVHDNCDPDCPYDRPAQALRIAWRAVLASGAARAALLSALDHDDCVPREDYAAAVSGHLYWRAHAECAEAERDREKERADHWMRACAQAPCRNCEDRDGTGNDTCAGIWLDGQLDDGDCCPPCWARLSLSGKTGACVGCGTLTNGWFEGGTAGPGWYCGWCAAVPGSRAELDGGDG